MTTFIFYYLLKALFPNPIVLGARDLTNESGEGGAQFRYRFLLVRIVLALLC